MRINAIRGLGGRAAVISFTRLLNQGLFLISPVVLVRLLPVEDFGRYREFLLYTTVLLNFAVFGINSSLLRFVPERPEFKWHYVRQTVLMTLAASGLTAIGALVADFAMGGELLGEFALPTVVYVLLYANVDFWEFLWLAEKRSFAVLGYSSGRLIARMLTVIIVAWSTTDVTVMIWSLVCLEAVRLGISTVAWGVLSRRPAGDTQGTWRAQLSYCLSFGGSMLVGGLNRAAASLFVAKLLGPVALAHFVVGTYVQPVVTVIRNSLSDVLMPEMVARQRTQQDDRLMLFRRTTIVSAMLLFAAGVVLARFAYVLVTTLFTTEYESAVLIFQLFLLVYLREALDFGVPLRALNRTAPILHGNLLALLVNCALLVVLLPLLGVIGAVIAGLTASFIACAYLGRQAMLAYGATLNELVDWKDLGKIVLACALAAPVLYGDFWTERFGFLGAVLGGGAYLCVYFALLAWLRVPEGLRLMTFLRAAPGQLLQRSS